jgi:hypothetical protein
VCLSAIISANEKVDFNETGREHRGTGAQLSVMGDARSCGVKVRSAKHFRITRLCMTLFIRKFYRNLQENVKQQHGRRGKCFIYFVLTKITQQSPANRHVKCSTETVSEHNNAVCMANTYHS